MTPQLTFFLKNLASMCLLRNNEYSTGITIDFFPQNFGLDVSIT